MSAPGPANAETFNPWSVVNLVFNHLASHGLKIRACGDG